MKDRIKGFFIVWLVILILNQILIFRGCFAPYCLAAALPHTGLLAFLWVKFVGRSPENLAEKKKPEFQPDAVRKRETAKKSADNDRRKQDKAYTKKQAEPDPLKEIGDKYERYIGAEFEKKGDLVIYNGFIKGYEDQGVDLISISSDSTIIHLIQCKNWTRMRMSLAHMEDIYSKLNAYNYDCLSFPSYQVDDHRTTLSKNDNTNSILLKAKTDLPKLIIRKTLFIASEKVVDLEVGSFLTMMAPTIFRYKDMKIVMKKSG